MPASGDRLGSCAILRFVPLSYPHRPPCVPTGRAVVFAPRQMTPSAGHSSLHPKISGEHEPNNLITRHFSCFHRCCMLHIHHFVLLPRSLSIYQSPLVELANLHRNGSRVFVFPVHELSSDTPFSLLPDGLRSLPESWFHLSEYKPKKVLLFSMFHIRVPVNQPKKRTSR